MSLGKIYEVDKDAELVEKEMSNLLRLDIACGNNKQPGFIGIDLAENSQADFISHLGDTLWEFSPSDTCEDKVKLQVQPHLSENLFLKDSSVGEIFCSHFIEHVDSIKVFMEECWRIMANKAILHIIAPYYTSIRATQDFTHVRSISENTFLYFTKKWIDNNKLSHYNINCDFNIDSIKYIYYPEWAIRAKQVQEYARQHHWNVVMDIDIVMRALK